MHEEPPELTVLPPAGEPPPHLPSLEERQWAMACHLCGFFGYFFPFGHIFGPLAVWLLRGERYPLVDDQGKEAMNFQISISIYLLVAGVLAVVVIGFVLIGLLLVFHFIVVIIAAVRAKGGEAYRYPLTIRFFKQPER